MTDRSQVRLGKLPARHDPRTLKLADYVNLSALPKPKASVNWWRGVPETPMYRNDTLGDCTIAGAAHAVQEWSFWGKPYVRPTDAQVLRAYNILSPNDEGCVMLDVLKYWRKTGIAKNKISAFVKVDPNNTAHVKIAIDLFGGLYAGIALPLSAQPQKVWSVIGGPSGVPGSWGGHCVWLPAFSSSRIPAVTWGEELAMTWQFLRYCTDELYAILDQSWLGVDKVSPAGLNVAQLLADVKAL